MLTRSHRRKDGKIVTSASLVFLRRSLRPVAPNLKLDTKFTKNAKHTKNGEGVGTTVGSTHEEERSLFVFFPPFFVAFVPFVSSRLVAAALR